MGNTCGCVDQAEKDGEVKVEGSHKLTQQNAHRTAVVNNYRDSTLSKGMMQGHIIDNVSGLPQLFATDDQYLIELQKNAA